MGRGSAEGKTPDARRREAKGIDPALLVRGSRWKKPGFRSAYKLEKAGEKQLTLKPQVPFLDRILISREEFLSSDWHRVD